MKSCKLWSELDDDRGSFEWCKGKQAHCTCSGVESQCDYLKYFNQPQTVCEVLRARDRIKATAADVEPFLTAERQVNK